MGLRRSAASLVAVVVVGVCIGNALAGQVAVKAHTAASWSAASQDGKVHIVKFYAPWCGHCQKLAPDWDTLGSYFAKDSRVSVGKMDCTAAGKDACAAAGVKGYPTLKAFVNGQEVATHSGQRDLTSLKQFVVSSVKTAGK